MGPKTLLKRLRGIHWRIERMQIHLNAMDDERSSWERRGWRLDKAREILYRASLDMDALLNDLDSEEN